MAKTGLVSTIHAEDLLSRRISYLQIQDPRKKRHREIGFPSIHASSIQRGRELSTYPDCCKPQIERRMMLAEKIDEVDMEIRTLLTDLANADSKFDASHRMTYARAPIESSSGERICYVIHESAIEITRLGLRFAGSSAWSDTEIIWRRGIPAVAFGPCGEGPHARIEYVDLDSVIDTAKILELTASGFCGLAD